MTTSSSRSIATSRPARNSANAPRPIVRRQMRPSSRDCSTSVPFLGRKPLLRPRDPSFLPARMPEADATMPPMDGVSTPFEARHRALLEAIPDLLLRLRADGTYLEVAGDLSRLANPPETVIGRQRPRPPRPRHRRAADGGRPPGARDRRARDGELHAPHLRRRASATSSFGSRPAGPDEVVVIARDVTDVRTAIRELQESRARVVAAGDAARRRIERNLHDGAQQRLVTVALQLNLIAKRLESAPEAVPELLAAGEVRARAGDGGDPRARARPPSADPHRPRSRGRRARARRALAAAGRGARAAGRADRSRGRGGRVLRRRGGARERGEARGGAADHGSRRLRGRSASSTEVADDGCGGADENGSGLQGLADRVAAIGGRFAVSSVPGAGTALRAEIPAP